MNSDAPVDNISTVMSNEQNNAKYMPNTHRFINKWLYNMTCLT